VSDRSAIEWTEATWNPCPGLHPNLNRAAKHCYAETSAERFPRRCLANPFEQGFKSAVGSDGAPNLPSAGVAAGLVFREQHVDLFHEDVADCVHRSRCST